MAAHLALAAPALGDTATLQDPATSNATAIDDIYRVVLGVLVTIFVLVGGWLLYTAVRFRDRGRPDAEEPPAMHGSTRLELGWTIVPVLILVGIAAFTFAKLPDVKRSSAGAMHVRVDSFQFGWTFTYPGGKRSKVANTLVVPVDTSIDLDLHSRDVMHAFWVPQIGPQVYTIPGRTTHEAFTARKIGQFEGQCAFFCGVGHAQMIVKVKVLSRDDFAAFRSRL